MAKLFSEVTAGFGRGMQDDVSAIRYPSDAAAEITNGRIQPDATIRRRPGCQRTHSTALNSGAIVYGALEFKTAAGTIQWIVFAGTKAYKSENSGASWTEIGTGLREDYYSFATMRVGADMFLYAANGDTTVKRWDGTTFDTNPNAPSGVKFLAVFNARLWYAGHSGPLVVGTKIADPSVIASPDGVTITVLTHDGDAITGLFQIGPHLLVFDEDSTSYIDGFGEQTIIVAAGATGFSRSVGCIAFRTLASVGENAACWLSKRGIEYYAPNVGIRLVSRGIQKFLQTINRVSIFDAPGIPTATYDWISQEYYCALPNAGTTNDRVAVINLLQSGRDWFGAPEIDEYSTSSASAEVLFDDDADAEGYFATDAGGTGLRNGAEGYADLAEVGEGSVKTIEDAQGYLSSDIANALTASLFVAADDTRGSVVFSAGYDGFVRKHDSVDLDDMLSDGTGGFDVELNVVSRPFLFGNPRQRKRSRVIHSAVIADAATTADISVRANGAVLAEHENVAYTATAFNQPKRKGTRTLAIGDEPQVVFTSVDDVRLALLGLSAEKMREPF